MTQEDRELLLKDLCARLPYGVICDFANQFDATIDGIIKDEVFTQDGDNGYKLDKVSIKPYLRPMSSMTEEEIWEIDNTQTGGDFDLPNGEGFTWLPNPDISDYLNSIHVDYRGLIPKGLAIEVTEENNPYE